ncbi:hypothetical protein GCK32_020869 [Trichostrongylus colubriformis]|uniref:Uncharacterized protein n=1 Tax=Trichostrongylus colubriformis TaxID=6319 RepID=A0AAN8IW94_TRICO
MLPTQQVTHAWGYASRWNHRMHAAGLESEANIEIKGLTGIQIHLIQSCGSHAPGLMKPLYELLALP